MARERKVGETLEQLTKSGGAVRLPRSKRLALPHCVEEFLSLTISPPDDFALMSERKQAEIEREMMGFAKAQEKLREFIALAGTDAIADLADVRDDRQPRPQDVGGLRVWMR